MKRIYISGPMTGIPEYNYPAFDRAAIVLSEHGYEPVNPAEISRVLECEFAEMNLTPNRFDYLRRDIAELVKCNGIFMLPGWQDSEGAKLEHTVALACGIEEVTI